MKVSMFLWAALVLAAGRGAAAESFLSNISRNLRSELSGVMEMATVSYSEPAINTTYVATVEFDMRAMGSLYNSTHLVIDFIANKQAYPEGFVSISDGNVEVESPRREWRALAAHYAGPLAVLVLAALLVAALPLAGLFWCCCYWCRSGRRRRAFDRKYDACLKGILAIVLIGLLTLFLFGVVCAFATDSQLETSAGEAPGSLRAGLRDTRAFLNATQAHARWLLVTNYQELEHKLNGLLASTGMTVSVQLGEFSRAVSVTTLNTMVQRLDGVAADLRAVRRLTLRLRAHADQLNSGLRKVKGQLLATLAQCSQPPCVRLQEKYKLGQLDTEIQYNQMPDVSELLNNVTALLDARIQEDVADGQRVFKDIQRAVRRELEQHIPDVQAELASTGRRLHGVADEITSLAGNASLRLQQREDVADELQKLHQRYGPYRRYLGLATATALLMITVLLALGLTCGVCGKRPDVYGASDCCNKGSGSSCLLCGMCAMFLVGGWCAAVLAAYFLLGTAAQRAVCDPLTEPRGNRLFEDVDRFVELEKVLFNERREPGLNLSTVLQACHANRTIYTTLQLHRLYDLEALVADSKRSLAARTALLRVAAPAAAPVTILKPSAKDKLRQLAGTGLSDFNFDKILHALETNMTSLSLEGLAAQLNSTALAVEERSGYSRVAPELRRAAAALATLHRGILLPLLADTAELNTTAMKLRDGLRFNHTSLKEAISYLLYETSQAEHYLNTQGPELVQNITREFGDVVSTLVQQYLERLQDAAEHSVGRCGPLSNAFNATRDAACHKILMPWNGYWMSLAWCVALLVPLMLAGARLARLYTHVDPYPGPLHEAEYLYDAYADRDNVPLANAYKAEKRGGRSRPHAAGEARGAGAGPALATPLDAHARRYNDMAPKHWEEGPPRYHGPTEYERPPPYYYPGPNIPRAQRRRSTYDYYY
ncbi:prominin-like protein isoform X1 [Ostrinia furnacalis]|uniref:prominin-like protein isoform X1 n=1 Tax=Ostrinia furnacalis TaxID=93504 RepID=UPI00103AC28C|nr:prominin-like protein isoform X1 [Ostrinia furnacalis]